MPFWKPFSSLKRRKTADSDATIIEISILDTMSDEIADEIEDLYHEGHTEPKEIEKKLEAKGSQSPGRPAIKAQIAYIENMRRVARAAMR